MNTSVGSLILLAALAAPAYALEPVALAGHEAFYTLTMDRSRQAGSDLVNASGSMAYEITDACDAWASRQRLTINTSNRDGQDIEMVSDYVTWESKDGLSMRFRMRQTTETAVTEMVEGTATLERTGGPGTIEYTLPEPKVMPLPPGTLFPMMHTAAIIAAAEAGQKYMAVPLFDGTGDKGAQDSGVAIAQWGPTSSARYPALAALPSGRVRIAFFDRPAPPTAEKNAAEKSKTAGAPDYEVGMRYYANGVADDLSMDFSDFVLSGKLTQFKLPPPHC